MYLSDLAMRFHNVATSALNGDYHTSDSRFFEVNEDGSTDITRLRATVHKMNTDFATFMREKSMTLKQSKAPSKGTALTNGVTAFKSLTENAIEQSQFGPKYVTEAHMKTWVKETYAKTRGRELPGNYNHVLLTELFHHQSQHWSRIAGDLLDIVHDVIEQFVKRAIAYLNVEDHVRFEIQEITAGKLQDNQVS